MKNGQKFKYRGKTYKLNWKGSPIHIAGISAAMILACAWIWAMTCAFAAMPLE